jgi:carbonic anhydrase
LSEILEFLAGFERFQQKYFAGEPGLYARLNQGQQPRAMVIACCDSRVDPLRMLGADPGELFVVRNVANLVPPYERNAPAPGIRADVEFAVKGLNVKHILVLGHSSCGGIRALMEGEGITENQYEFIGAWVSIAAQARERTLREMPGATLAEQAKACELLAVRLSLDNLMSFPWIHERVTAGALELHGWYFDMECGELLGYAEKSGRFEPLVARLQSQ